MNAFTCGIGRLGAFVLEEVATLLASLDAGIGDARRDQLDGANRVIVSGDDEIDQVWVAVGVGERDNRNVKLTCLVDGDVLVVRIDDEEHRRKAVHHLDAAEVLLELFALAADGKGLLFAERVDRTVLDLLLDVAEA